MPLTREEKTAIQKLCIKHLFNFTGILSAAAAEGNFERFEYIFELYSARKLKPGLDINEVVKAIFTCNRQNDAINEPGEYCKILECILENCDKNPALKAKLDISGMLTSAAWEGYFCNHRTPISNL